MQIGDPKARDTTNRLTTNSGTPNKPTATSGTPNGDLAIGKRVSVAGAVLVAGTVAVGLLAPGGLGDPEVLLVTEGGSAELYRDMAHAGRQVPTWLAWLGEHGALVALLVLAALLGWSGWSGLRLRTAAPVGGTVLVGLGAVLAYLLSEGIKLVVDQERPCRALAPVETWVPCPAAGDWSFPSNHSTVAGALAAGVVLLAPRLVLLAVPAAGAVAALRVLTGVHYPHDVLAGLLLGASVTVALLVLLQPLAGQLVTPLLRPRQQSTTA